MSPAASGARYRTAAVGSRRAVPSNPLPRDSPKSTSSALTPLAVAVDEDVGWLHVAVDDTELVHVVQRGEHAGCELQRGRDADRAAASRWSSGSPGTHGWTT